MQVVIDRYQKYGIKPRSDENLQTFQMDYYRFSKDYDAFKRLAETYVDSLIRITSYNVCYTKLLRILGLMSVLNYYPKIYRVYPNTLIGAVY